MPGAAAGAQEVLRLEGITKRFGRVTANDAITFSLGRGEVLALLGENGAGKTTLMNILFGQYTADEGHVEVFGARLPPGNPTAALAAGVGMVHQHFTLAQNLRVWENISLGTGALLGRLDAGAIRDRILDLAARYRLEVDPNARVADLSVGECQRVEILKALYRDARILILDEPTAVLTPQEVEDLFRTLREAVSSGLSVIFISHKLKEVMAIADRVAVLRHGRLVAERAARQTTREELVALMVGASVAAPQVQAHAPGPVVLSLTGVSTAAGDSRQPLRDVTLELRAGQITGLAGVSGNGQAALSDLVAGMTVPVSGRIALDGASPGRWDAQGAVAAGVARIPEDRHGTGTIADFDLTENAILETYGTRFSRSGWMDWRAARRFAEKLIRGYDIRCPGPQTRIRLLSGGNMQKLILGRVLDGAPRVILANQPVRGLDIGAVNFVHGELLAARERGAAILLISEDLDEILSLSDVIHVISRGRLSPEFARGTVQAADLGPWMAGHGFEETSDAA